MFGLLGLPADVEQWLWMCLATTGAEVATSLFAAMLPSAVLVCVMKRRMRRGWDGGTRTSGKSGGKGGEGGTSGGGSGGGKGGGGGGVEEEMSGGGGMSGERDDGLQLMENPMHGRGSVGMNG